MKKLLLILLCLPMIGFGQDILISNKQAFFIDKYDINTSIQDKERKIIVYKDSIQIDLFNGDKISSKISFYEDLVDSDGSIGKRYSVHNYKNGLIVIYDKKVFLNLDLNGAVGTYYLEGYIFPNEQEQKKINDERNYKANVNQYGKLTADCIVKKKICVGMSWMGVFDILGEPLKQDLIESSSKSSVILTFDNITVYCEMKKNGVFVERVHYHNY